MRVLMFGWEFPPHITGGLGTACLGLTKGLIHNDVEVTFVVPKLLGGEGEGRIRMQSAEAVGMSLSQEEIKRFSSLSKILSIDSFLFPYARPESIYQASTQEHEHIHTVHHWTNRHFTFSGKYGAGLLDEVARYAVVAGAMATREKFDIIHAHDWLTYPAGIAAKTVSGKPLVVHVHATEFDRSGEHVNQQVYDIEREGMQAADLVIAVSNRTRHIVIEKYGIPAEKVVTVHNAVDFAISDDNSPIEKPFPEKIVTFLGRITFQKGPDYFVEAAHQILQKMDNVRFVMAGSGDMLYRMIRRVAELGIASRFHFAGFLRGEEVDRMFRMSDVYVMPSVSEPFGISPLEAMRSQVPVIISRQSGVAEVLKYAIKIDFWDIDAMADAIYGLLNYDALSAFFRKHGQREVTELRWDSASLYIKELYQQVLSSRESHP